MTISSQNNRITYSGNAVTTAFSFPYKFSANADLKIYQDDVLKTITTHYTVTGAGDDGGGTVTFVTAPAVGTSNIVILCDPAVLQGLDLVENDPLPAETVEDALDLQTMIMRRHKDLLDRAFVLSDSDVSGASLAIPTPEAQTVIGWNSTSDALENKTLLDFGALAIPVSIADGGTGSATAATARTALGLAIGSDVQAYDADTVKTDVAQNFTLPQRSALLTDNDGSFDIGAKQNFKSTPTAGITLTFTNQADGVSGSVILINGSNYAVAAHANTKISSAALTRISATGTYRIDFISDGTNAYCTASESLA